MQSGRLTSTEERIYAAAIRTPDGKVWAITPPARHCHVIWWLNPGKGYGPADFHDQGFITNMGRYVHRKAAWRIAVEADQLIRVTGPHGTLFSEDLW